MNRLPSPLRHRKLLVELSVLWRPSSWRTKKKVDKTIIKIKQRLGTCDISTLKLYRKARWKAVKLTKLSSSNLYELPHLIFRISNFVVLFQMNFLLILRVRIFFLFVIVRWMLSCLISQSSYRWWWWWSLPRSYPEVKKKKLNGHVATLGRRTRENGKKIFPFAIRVNR